MESGLLCLAFYPNIPLFKILQNSAFSLTILLLNTANSQLKADVDVPIEVSLIANGRECLEGTLKLLSPVDVKCGKCVLSLKITETSLSLGADQLELQIKCRVASQELSAFQPIMCYKHRLKITNSGNIPSIFFKDDIGKDKFIDICLALVDGDDQIVGRQIRLKANLIYAAPNEIEVARQDILILMPGTQLTVDQSGTAFIRFRINDVSKNHQQQSFQLLISPDTVSSPIDIDIEPITTTPINVKSKRKRMLEPAGQNETVEEIALAAKTMRKVDMADTSCLHRSVGVMKCSTKRSQGLECWAESAVEALKSIRWKLIGHEMFTDGQETRPIFSMTNPNCIIDALIADYEAQVLQQRRQLLNDDFRDGSAEADTFLAGASSAHAASAVIDGGGKEQNIFTIDDVTAARLDEIDMDDFLVADWVI